MIDPALSRSGHTDPCGKLMQGFTLRLPEDIEERLIALAALHRKGKGEMARMLIEEALLGKYESTMRRVDEVLPGVRTGIGSQRGA